MLPAMNRRRLLLPVPLSLVAAVGLLAGVNVVPRSRPPGAEAWGALAAALFADVEQAVVLGRRCLLEHPQLADPARLVEALGLSGPGAAPVASATDLRRRMDRQRRQDFLSGTTVTVDGWILARTEAALVVLVALTARQRGRSVG